MINFLAISSSLVTFVCLVAVLMLREELRGQPEKRFFIGFFIFALLFFLSHLENLDSLFAFDATEGELFADVSTALLALAICIRSGNRTGLTLLSVVLVISVGAHLLTLGSAVFSIVTSVFYVTSSVVFTMRRKPCPNLADYGLVIAMATFILLMVLEWQFAPGLDEETVLLYYMVAFPAYICAITVFLLLSYMFDANNNLFHLANYDPLSHLPNRRFGFKAIEAQLARIQRQKGCAAILMTDIDKFKQVNDTYGHIFGDEVIRQFSQAIENEVRAYDICCRYGGEEFLVFFPDTNLAEAADVAERIRTRVKQTRISVEAREAYITASFGLAAYQHQHSLKDNIERADRALYEAKRAGRDRVSLASCS